MTETRLSASRHNGWVASDGMRNGTPDGTPFGSSFFGSSTMLGSVNDGDGGRHHHHGQGGIAILAQSIGGVAGRPTCRAFAPARRSRAR
jgi:hypothetical protein